MIGVGMTAHVINLPNRPDRLAAFAKRAAAAALPYRVQPGVSPKVMGNWRGSRQSLGCMLAHLAILESTHGKVLIFEDDALVPVDLRLRIADALEAMPDDWEVLVIGAGQVAYGGKFRPPVHDVRSWALTHAYLVSERGRRHVQGVTDVAVRHWDHALGPFMGSRGKSWVLCPPIGQDTTLGSDIPDSARHR